MSLPRHERCFVIFLFYQILASLIFPNHTWKMEIPACYTSWLGKILIFLYRSLFSWKFKAYLFARARILHDLLATMPFWTILEDTSSWRSIFHGMWNSVPLSICSNSSADISKSKFWRLLLLKSFLTNVYVFLAFVSCGEPWISYWSCAL